MDYDSYDEESGDELTKLGAKPGKKGITNSKVYKRYASKRQTMRDLAGATKAVKKKVGRDKFQSIAKFKMTSKILSQIVKDFETGNPGANTHVIVKDGDNTTLYQANTATGVKLAVGKLKFKSQRVAVNVASARAQKVKNLHTEMFILYKATNGDVKKVPNILAGKTILVDKPCCKMCYYWMKKAGANVVDGTVFATTTGANRDAFVWANPFDGARISASTMAGYSDIQLANYVNTQVT